MPSFFHRLKYYLIMIGPPDHERHLIRVCPVVQIVTAIGLLA